MRQLIEDMANFLLDCGIDAETVLDLTVEDMKDWIENNYHGGFDQFIIDGGE